MKWFALWLLLFTASFIDPAWFRRKHNKPVVWHKRRVVWGLTSNVPMAIIGIFEELVTLSTLGYRPQSWTLRFIAWRTLRSHRRYKEKNK